MADVVIGIGNVDRGDDAVGFQLVDLLRDHVAPSVRLAKHGGDATGLLWLWEGADRVFIVDAMVTGKAPGTIHWLRADALHEAEQPERPASGHRLGASDAIGLARALGVLPPHVIVCGIEGGNFSYGAGLSKPVQSALGCLRERIVAALRAPR